MTAIYVWLGRRCRDSKAVMIVKTRAALADIAIATVRGLHPYENPAIVVFAGRWRVGRYPGLDREPDKTAAGPPS